MGAEHGREPASRIVLVSHSPWSGGAERALAELAEALADAPDRSIHVVLPGAGALRDRLAAGGIATTVVPGRWWARDPGTRPRRPDVRAPWDMARALSGLRPDVVMSNTMVHPPGALAARALGLPHLWWIHEFGERDHGYRFLLGRRATVRAIGRLSALVLAASEAVRRELARNLAAHRLRPLEGAVAMAPVAAPRAPSPPAGRARLVLVGRVRPSKGFQDAVRAVHHLERAGVEVELDVGG